jgi:hypothetical protein
VDGEPVSAGVAAGVWRLLVDPPGAVGVRCGPSSIVPPPAEATSVDSLVGHWPVAVPPPPGLIISEPVSVAITAVPTSADSPASDAVLAIASRARALPGRPTGARCAPGAR